MRRLLMAGLAVLATLAVGSGFGPVAVPGGLLLAFALPGTALVGALFPAGRLRRLERYVLSVALSLAVLVLGGLGLYAVGLGLHRVTWAALTVGVALLASIRGGTGEPLHWPGARRLAPLALALALLAGAGWVSLASAARQRAATHVTVLSIVDVSDATAAGTRAVTLEVTNQESAATGYTLSVTGPDGYAVTVGLTASKTSAWRRTIVVPANERVTASLYRSGDPTAYRTVFVHGVAVAQ